MSTVNINEILAEISKYLTKLPFDVQELIMEALDKYLPRILRFDKMPAWLRLLTAPVTANAFVHLIVKITKEANCDNRDGRTKILNWSRLLFQLPDWTPEWLYEPFDSP